MGRLLERTRFVSVVGVLSLLVASVAAFGWGVAKTVIAVIVIISSLGKDPSIAIALIEVVDSMLIATALFVFAASMYQLFIEQVGLPGWMLAHDLYELKNKLSGVIILVMAVKFLEHVVEWKDGYESLLFALAIAAVSAVLIALSHFVGKD